MNQKKYIKFYKDTGNPNYKRVSISQTLPGHTQQKQLHWNSSWCSLPTWHWSLQMPF